MIATRQQLRAELRKANRIIAGLARLVRHYGYKDEMPDLRTRQRSLLLKAPTTKGDSRVHQNQ